ncbi:MAG: hypothetical protein QM692_01545 [Thermomicrobiales bacterium]
MSTTRRNLLGLATAASVALILPDADAAKNKKKRKSRKQRRCKGLPSALSIVQALQAAGLPIGAYEEYTIYTDPNEMMGRPGGYTSKVNFLDTRLEREYTDEYDVSDGGSVEFFANTKNLQARVKHLEFVQATIPLIDSEVMITHGTALLRVSNRLLITYSDGYRGQFRTLKICSK